jgi:hypothetical protein
VHLSLLRAVDLHHLPGHDQRDDALHTQDLQHRDHRRMRIAGRARCPARAVAARQVAAKKLLDAAFVEHARRQRASRHPVREVRYGAQAAPARLGGIPAALQPIDIAGTWADSRPSSSQARRIGCSSGITVMTVSSGGAVGTAPATDLCPVLRVGDHGSRAPARLAGLRHPRTCHNWCLCIKTVMDISP